MQRTTVPRTACFLCLTIVLLAAPARGRHQQQQKEEGDSLRTYRLEEIIVTGTAHPVPRSEAPSRATVLSQVDLLPTGGASLGDVLAREPGLFIRQYGPGGGLQTASFRGMGAEHTAVLLDGLPIGNVQTGLTDLRLIPLGQLEQVELIRGGSSGLYGSTAVGGVINLITESPAPRPSSLTFRGGGGSFGRRDVAAGIHIAPDEKLDFSAGGGIEYGRGNYLLSSDDAPGGEAPMTERLNSDYRRSHLFMKGVRSTSGRTRSSFLLSVARADRGTPGPLVSASRRNSARQADEQLLAALSHRAEISSSLHWSIGGNFQNAYERYLDLTSFSPRDNFYRNIFVTASSFVRCTVSPQVLLSAGIEHGDAVASGNALPEQASRSHTAVTVASEAHIGSLGTSRLRFSFYPSVRYDTYPGLADATSPKIGLNVRYALSSNVRPERSSSVIVHSTLGRDFRVPTLNELYYAGEGGRGNPALVPERSTSFDAGMTLVTHLFGEQELDVTYYVISTAERIVWLPRYSAVIWSPVNVAKTLSSGFEIDLHWSAPGDRLVVQGNYSFIDAKKKDRAFAGDPSYDAQLIYVPLETANFSLSYSVPVHAGFLTAFSLRAAESYVGRRYTVEDNSVALPPYDIFAAGLSIDLALGGTAVTLSSMVENLFNSAYEVVPRYPMPLRAASLLLSIQMPY